MTNKKAMENPSFEVIRFENEDVMTTSQTNLAVIHHVTRFELHKDFDVYNSMDNFTDKENLYIDSLGNVLGDNPDQDMSTVYGNHNGYTVHQ